MARYGCGGGGCYSPGYYQKEIPPLLKLILLAIGIPLGIILALALFLGAIGLSKSILYSFFPYLFVNGTYTGNFTFGTGTFNFPTFGSYGFATGLLSAAAVGQQQQQQNNNNNNNNNANNVNNEFIYSNGFPFFIINATGRSAATADSSPFLRLKPHLL